MSVVEEECNGDDNTGKPRLISVGPYDLQTLVLGPQQAASQPLVLCFVGSNDTYDSWLPLSVLISRNHPVLLYNRAGHGDSTGPRNQTADDVAQDLLKLLTNMCLGGPYVLIAHSYGGAIARSFLHFQPSNVVGMILAETGQETSSAYEEQQYETCALKNHPLAVIRANSLITKWSQWENDVKSGLKSKEQLQKEKNVLDLWEKEDRRLKRRQLDLSKNTRWIEVHDCGHGIIRERPDVVAEAVEWVMENLKAVTDVQHHGLKKQGVREQLLESMQRVARMLFGRVKKLDHSQIG